MSLATDWVQRSDPFLVAMMALAVVLAAIYASVYWRERAGLARPKRMRSSKISAIGLILFSGLLALRVFVLHS